MRKCPSGKGETFKRPAARHLMHVLNIDAIAVPLGNGLAQSLWNQSEHTLAAHSQHPHSQDSFMLTPTDIRQSDIHHELWAFWFDPPSPQPLFIQERRICFKKKALTQSAGTESPWATSFEGSSSWVWTHETKISSGRTGVKWGNVCRGLSPHGCEDLTGIRRDGRPARTWRPARRPSTRRRPALHRGQAANSGVCQSAPQRI